MRVDGRRAGPRRTAGLASCRRLRSRPPP
jgi:hypothetical protein